MIKVLHVTPYFPPDRIGGVGEHVRVIHEGYLEGGGHSEVLTSGISANDERVHRISPSISGFGLNAWRFARTARDFDIIHVHHGEALGLLILLKARNRRPKILLMNHVDVRRRESASRPFDYRGQRIGPRGIRAAFQRVYAGFKALVERMAWKLADEVVVETQSVKSELEDLKPRHPITVIPHGVGPAYGEPKLPPPADLLFVGTPGIRKRTFLLPEILNEVLRKVPKATLRIVGVRPR